VKRKPLSRDSGHRPSLVKYDIERHTDRSIAGDRLIVSQVRALRIASDNVVDGDGNTELSLATDITVVRVQGLLLDRCNRQLACIDFHDVVIWLTCVCLSNTDAIHVAPDSLGTISEPDLMTVLVVPLAGTSTQIVSKISK
jgi:hypothetical protein